MLASPLDVGGIASVSSRFDTELTVCDGLSSPAMEPSRVSAICLGLAVTCEELIVLGVPPGVVLTSFLVVWKVASLMSPTYSDKRK